MLRITQLKVGLEDTKEELETQIRKKLKIGKRVPFTCHVHKRNVDARERPICFVYSVDVQIAKEKEIARKHYKDVMPTPPSYGYRLQKGVHYMKHRPVVVGFGPAGMFAALLLAQNGYAPIVLERGEEVEKRTKSVEAFFTSGILNEESNIQYGEGGAGTFSDGKLTARSKDPRVQKVYKTLISFGAPKEIAYEGFPHVGSDKLKGIVKNIRKEIIRLNGEVHFSTKVEKLLVSDGKICGVETNQGTYYSNHVILAIGNSARDTLVMLQKTGVQLSAKDFALGVRIEHKQSDISEALYHEWKDHPNLPSASYRLTSRGVDDNILGAYTFCMCPGGTVVAATSLKEHVVVNGMSDYARAEENANSALLVPISASRFAQEDLFAGMRFLDEIEKKAYVCGGKTYQAPAQLVKDFLERKPSEAYGDITPSYPLGVKMGNLWEILPSDVCESLRNGLLVFDKKLQGFAKADAILTGVETRSSSPIRIERDKDTLQSITIKGLYPCGEGAGYAGGIVSSAIDGMKCAEKIIENNIWEEIG